MIKTDKIDLCQNLIESPCLYRISWWLAVFLILPWLSPYTAGPTPNVWPLLLSALCAVVLWFFRGQLNARLVTAGWLTAAALSALIGLVQYFGLAQALSPWISQTQVGEAFANLRQRNQFATLTSIGLVGLAAGAGQRRQQFAHRLAAMALDCRAHGLVAPASVCLAGAAVKYIVKYTGHPLTETKVARTAILRSRTKKARHDPSSLCLDQPD